MAMPAYSILTSSAAAWGSSSASSRLAAGAGTAMITASASTISGAGTGPVTSRHPPSVLRSSLTMTPVLISAPEAAATASGRLPIPRAGW